MRSFIGAYQVLSRVISQCPKYLSPFEDLISGKKLCDKIIWTEAHSQPFINVQQARSTARPIVIPQTNDQLWIVNDGTVSQPIIASTVYATRNNKPLPAGLFSAKL